MTSPNSVLVPGCSRPGFSLSITMGNISTLTYEEQQECCVYFPRPVLGGEVVRRAFS